ncbi:hypothetical protein QTH11_01765 [Clostridium perfringens]|nr:hypothetical protein [Clostridium perfringens]
MFNQKEFLALANYYRQVISNGYNEVKVLLGSLISSKVEEPRKVQELKLNKN